ncbi:MAG: hypothetical protein HDQ90_09400, partial [Desulfovibrio sp.]|nr:hypothetical protein [Desulfovibrio sp.]
MKRLALYVLWEKKGNVHKYVIFYLEALKKIAEKIVVIVNGGLSESGRRVLQELGVDVFIRENRGLDFGAWKAALQTVGWEQVCTYDEVILCNCSCYGPLYPFTEVFATMDERECDFWGLYRHPGIEGTYQPHLQSYFLVIRTNLLRSKTFREYWRSLKPANNWSGAVEQETQFTRYFEEKGFSSCAFIEDCDSSRLIEDATILLPHKILLENAFPLLKRKAFTTDYSYFFKYGNVSQAKELLKIIDNSQYPIEYIFDDLLKNMQISDIRKVLHHTFILNDEYAPALNLNGQKIALILYSYYEDLIADNISYMRSMPPKADIYIVVVSDTLKDIWEQKKSRLTNQNIQIRKQQNRGRNECAYWLTCKDVIQSYDFICVAHDKKSETAKPPLIGYSFSRHCLDNILKSPDYVQSVLALMLRHPEIGIFMPPLPIFGGLGAMILNNEWADNKKIAQDIYTRLQMKVPFDMHPDAPWGTMFWLRGKAMAPFYRYSWTVEDFPEEPLGATNGTVLHALERMYPMIAQEAGYFSAWIMPASEAGVHLDNFAQYNRAMDFMNNFMQAGRNVHY